jgi:hypothetical protein
MVGVRRFLVLAVILAVLSFTCFAGWRSERTIKINPSGAYAVGVGRHDWVDRARIDQFAPLGGAPRLLSAWVWYPAVPGLGKPSEYAPGPWAGLHRFGWAQTDFDRIHPGTRDDPPFAAGAFPLVVLLPSLGLAAPQYQALAAGLASRGYVVAGVTPTYSASLSVLSGRAVPASAAGRPSRLTATASDQLVSVWAADALFAAGRAVVQYNGHVDPAHVVYVGHGLGGAAASAACSGDSHCAGFARLGRQLTLSSAGLSRAYTIEGAGELAVTDYSVYHLALPVRSLLPLGRLDGRRALDITTGVLADFLATALVRTPWKEPPYAQVRETGIAAR